MNKAEFITPVVTAFDGAGRLDRQANRHIWNRLIGGGVDGLVLLGSTGEFFSMTLEQKQELITLAAAEVGDRAKLLVGTASMDVEETIALSNFALEAGADGVLVIGPYYFSLSDESIESFYDQVAAAVRGNLLLYNFPERNGYSISPQVTVKLLHRHKNIVGFKDSVTGIAHTRELLTTTAAEFPDFAVYSGFDDTFVHNLCSGGAGCIGGLSNVYPGLFADWARAVNKGDLPETARIQRKVNKLMELYGVGTPFIPVVKRAMQLVGVEMEDHCTRPFLPVTDGQEQAIRAILDAVEQM